MLLSDLLFLVYEVQIYYEMQNINEISWGGKTYPSPTHIANRMPRTPEEPVDAEEGLEFPGERYKPPFSYTEIVGRAGSGATYDNNEVVTRLRGVEYALTQAGVRIIELVADPMEHAGDMKYSFHITFQGFTGYYSWADEWIGFDADGQDVYGRGLPSLMRLQSDHEDWD